MATPADIAERRRKLFGSPSSDATGKGAAALAAVVAEQEAEIARLQARIDTFESGLVDKVARQVAEQLRSTGAVLPMTQQQALPAPMVDVDQRGNVLPARDPASGGLPQAPTYYLLETRDPMGNPRVVRVTPHYNDSPVKRVFKE